MTKRLILSAVGLLFATAAVAAPISVKPKPIMPMDICLFKC